MPVIDYNNERHHAILVSLTRSRLRLSGDEVGTFREVTEAVAEALEAERVSIWLFDNDGASIVCQDLFQAPANTHSRGMALNKDEFPVHFRALVEEEAGSAAGDLREPRSGDNTGEEPLMLPATLDVPVLVADRLEGILSIEQTGGPREWSHSEQSFAWSVANLISLKLAQRAQARSERRLRTILKNEPERVKELRAMHNITALLQDATLPTPEVLSQVAVLLSRALQFPECAAAVVTYGSSRAATPDYTKSPWEIETEFATEDGQKGMVRLAYLEERPPADEGPFLAEERDLLRWTTEVLTSHFERIQSAATARDNQTLLQMASKAGRLGAWSVELPSLKHSWSEETREIHEVAPGVFPGMEELFAFYPGEHQARLRRFFQTCADKGIPFDEEFQFVTAKGRMIWVRVIGEAVRDESGAIVRVQGAIQDIDDRKKVEDSLAASEARFQALAESMPMIVWMANPIGEVDYANDRFFEYTGASRQETIGTAWQPTFHRDDLDRCLAIWEESVRQGKLFATECRLRRESDGSYRWFHVQAVPIRDAHGEIVRWYGTLIDVHDTKRLEEEATRLSRRFSTTLESITDAFYMVDRQWRFTYVNPEAERLLERPREELLGRNIWEEFREAVGTPFYHAYHRAMNENVTVALEEFYEPIGRWFDEKIYPSEEGLAVYFRDVTERRRNRDAMAATEAKLREQAALLDKAQDAILVRDLDHRILYWNKSAARLYGWSMEEALGRPVQDLLYRDPTAFLVATEIVLSKGEWIGELEQFTKEGDALTVEARWTLVRDDNGDPRSILGINTDITERKKLETQFLRAQRMESIGTLAGGIAHDLNNILAPIVMGVELLKVGETDPQRLSLLSTIYGNARRGADMIKQVLSFARGAETRQSLIDVRELACDIRQIIRDTFPKNVDFELKAEVNLWPVEADGTQLHQLLMNLCVNARDAMPDGGKLTLALENRVLHEADTPVNPAARAGPYVLIRVEDNGKGMPRRVQEKIFDPFFTTKEIGKGTGLGLSTVLTIVKSHDGFVQVYSEPDKGAKFCIYLPARTTANAAESVSPQPMPLPRGNGELILVVDDEEPIRNMVEKILDQSGYRVELAENGAEAVAIYEKREHEIAAVLTDMAMPVMDGPATILALQAMNPQVKIIGSSGHSAKGHLAKETGKQLRHFIPKPYTAETLLTTLQRILKPAE